MKRNEFVYSTVDCIPCYPYSEQRLPNQYSLIKSNVEVYNTCSQRARTRNSASKYLPCVWAVFCFFIIFHFHLSLFFLIFIFIFNHHFSLEKIDLLVISNISLSMIILRCQNFVTDLLWNQIKWQCQHLHFNSTKKFKKIEKNNVRCNY